MLVLSCCCTSASASSTCGCTPVDVCQRMRCSTLVQPLRAARRPCSGCDDRDARTIAAHSRPSRRGAAVVRRRAHGVLRPARPAAHADSRRAGRHLRHPDRAHRRAVPACASARCSSNEAADYLEMAARLLRIKAQMLLPRGDGEEAWDDPRAELVRRLLEYQQMREVVDVLERARRGAAQPVRARVPAAGAPRRPRRRSRSRSASCSPPSIACCASRASRRCTTSSRARSTSRARSRSSARCSRSARARAWTDLVAARRRALAGALDAARPARDGEAAASVASQQPRPFRQRGDHA